MVVASWCKDVFFWHGQVGKVDSVDVKREEAKYRVTVVKPLRGSKRLETLLRFKFKKGNDSE